MVMAAGTHRTHLKAYLERNRAATVKTTNKTAKGINPLKQEEAQKTSKCTKSNTHGRAPREYSLQKLKLKGRLSINDFLFEDEMLMIFRYVNASDLLRMMSVCKLWMNILTGSDLWRMAFRKLPKKVQAVSENAKKPKEINWRREIIFCCKRFRERTVEQRLNKRVDGLPVKMEEAVRYLDVRWLLVAEDVNGNHHECVSQEIFYFTSSVSIRWDELTFPTLDRILKLRLFALAPVFRSSKGSAVVDSVCTKSLIEEYALFGKCTEGKELSVARDQHVQLLLLKNLVIGLWCGQREARDKDLAFISCSLHLHENLTEKILFGNTDRQYTPPKHVPYEDDIDRSYGLHGYSGHVSIRNNRRTIWESHYREFFEYKWDEDMFLISHTRGEDYSYYDVDKEYDFVWKTAMLKGKVKNACMVDLTLMDQNQKIVWCTSRPVFIKEKEETDAVVSYHYEDASKMIIEVKDGPSKKLRIDLVQKSGSSQSTVIKVEVGLSKQYINSWFATNY